MPLYFSVALGRPPAKPQYKRIDNGHPPPRMQWDAKQGRNVLNLGSCTEDRKKPNRDCTCVIS